MKVVFAFSVNAIFNFIIGLLIARFLGSDEYGRFALILTTGVVIQVAFFDWLRLSAIRFYSERARAEEPQIRKTLDSCFAVLAFFFIALSIIAWVLDCDVRVWNLHLTKEMIALALAIAVVNEFFDYTAALVRARFLDRLYNAIILIKNFLSIGLTTFAAYYFRNADMAMAGAILSLFAATFVGLRSLREAHGGLSKFEAARARAFFAYASPIITANLLYLLVPYVNRVLVANYYGYAEVGRFSLPYDLGQRALLAIGSALDVLLFQIAVRVRETQGPEKAKEQIARNFIVILAVLAPACVGSTLILPSMEAVVVPQEFRGDFGHYFILMQPGLLAFAIINFALNPVFQIEKKTSPLIWAAAAGSLCAPFFSIIAPRGEDAGNLAIAQSAAYIASLAVLLAYVGKTQPIWPKARDLLNILISVGCMAAAVWPLRALSPGLGAMIAQILIGGMVYASVALTLNIGGLRADLAVFVAKRRAAYSSKVF